MDRREFNKASRMRNGLALLLMAIAAIAAGRSHADETATENAVRAETQESAPAH
jgi:hypothetical protein